MDSQVGSHKVVRLNPLCWFTWHPFGGHLGSYRVLFGYDHEAIWGHPTCSSTQQSFYHHLWVWSLGYQHSHHRSHLWFLEGAIIYYPICLGDDYEWFFIEFKEWRAIQDPCFIIYLSVLNPLDPWLSADILGDYTLEFEVKVESTLRNLRECLTEAIRDKDCSKEILDATMKDFNEMGRKYEVELAILWAKLAQRDQVPSSMKSKCTKLRSWVTSLESELANLTKIFTILG